MNNDSNVRSVFLDKANGATSILAILAAVSAFPGGLKLYQFLMDARDTKIEQVNLTGLGEFAMPGSDFVLKEPYTSLALFILSVAIPLVILISLLVKKRRLGQGKIAGRGLYWFVILLSIGGILGGLGILPKLVSANSAPLSDISTDPGSLAFIFGSVVAAVTAWFAIHFLGRAQEAPGTDRIQEARKAVSTPDIRRNGRQYEDDGVVPSDFVSEEPLTAADFKETQLQSPAPAAEIPLSEAAYERTFVSSAPESVAVPVASPEMVVDQPAAEVEWSEPTPEPDPAPGRREAGSAGSDQAVSGPAVPMTDVADSPVVTAAPAPVLKRKFISYPGDEDKVIVILREYQGDDLLREWAEIHAKSEFTRK